MNQILSIWFIYDSSKTNYSDCPKSEPPDFGVFEKCPVPKTSENRLAILRLKTGQKRPVFWRLKRSYCLKTVYSECPKTGRPVWLSRRKYVRFLNYPVIGRPVHTVMSGYRTTPIARTSDNRTKTSGFQTYRLRELEFILPTSRPKPVPNRFRTDV